MVAPALVDGTQVAEFTLYDAYFKTAFTAVDELRALGFDAAASPALWAARAEAHAFEARRLSPDLLDLQLVRFGAQEEVADLFRLDREQKVALYAARRTLLEARTALPPALRARAPSGRAIRDAYFLAEGAPEPPLALDIEVLDFGATAEEGAFGGGSRRGRVRLRALFVGRASPARAVAGSEHESEARAEGSGLSFHPARGYAFTLGADDPFERALRLALREAVADALPAIAAGAAGARPTSIE